jgi:hypothetical protein
MSYKYYIPGVVFENVSTAGDNPQSTGTASNPVKHSVDDIFVFGRGCQYQSILNMGSNGPK